MSILSLRTFGDQRRLILDTIQELKNGTMDVNRGMAIAACMKVVNDSVQAEIAYAKTAMQAKLVGHDFGKVVHMGQQLIGNELESINAP